MADLINRLKVLIASPGDVKAEREAAARVIDQVNTMLEKQGIELRAKMWEYDVVSHIGDRPQAIVNEQIGDTCDIFIGIMWSRIGTPTGVDESGTIEEFRRAKARLDADSRSVRILFFFCDRSLPITLDIDQFTAVRRFRTEVEKLGLISTYSSPDEFELKFRPAIHKHAIEWGDTWGSILDSPPSETPRSLTTYEGATQVSVPIYPAEEVGFLDAIEESTDYAEVATAAMDRIAEAINDLGENINQRSEDLNKLARHQPIDLKKAKKISNLAADHLETFSARLAADLPIQQKAFSKYLERMSDIVLLSQDFSMDEQRRVELATMRSTLNDLAKQMEMSITKTVGFQQSIVNSPRMTTRFNGARRQAEKVLNEFIDGARENLQLVTTIHDQIDTIIASH